MRDDYFKRVKKNKRNKISRQELARKRLAHKKDMKYSRIYKRN